MPTKGFRADEHGSNIWFEKDAMELAPEGFTCPHCGGTHFTKETDTLDCWFDSGSTHYASLMHRTPELWPADVYLEGADQYRGWFQSSLLTSVGALDQGAPFKQVLTHGWVVDGQGRAMHKSLGNGVDPADLIKDFGADIVRLWAASSDYHADVRCSKEIFKQISQNYLKFRNTCKFMLDNLVEFDPENLVKPEDMQPLDRWIITKLNELNEKVLAAYNNYEFHVVSHAINDFCVVDLSSFYLDITKDRLYCDGKDSLSRRAVQTALYLVLDTMCRLFAPILAFTCDEIWLAMPHKQGDDERNILLNTFNGKYTEYEQGNMISWASLQMLRSGVNAALEAARADKKIGKALEAHVVLVKDVNYPNDNLQSIQEEFQDIWADLFIVSDVEVSEDAELYAKAAETPIAGVRVLVSEANGVKCPRCWKHTHTDHADGLCARCAAVVEELGE